MLRYMLLFILMLPFVAAEDPLMSAFKLFGLMVLFTSLFLIIGMLPLNVMNKTINYKLNPGEMALAISIPAVISSIIQWILLYTHLLSIRTFIVVIFFLNTFLYFFVYFKLRAKRIREHPNDDYE